MSFLVPTLYLLSAVLFILGLKGLTRVKSARRGNALASLAMLIAVLATLVEMGVVNYTFILIGLAVGGLVGAVAAVKVEMTSMPEMVALFNGSGGGASALVASSVLWGSVIEPGSGQTAVAVLAHAPGVTTVLSMLIGALTLSGSVVAYAKLAGKMSGNPILLPGRHVLNGLLLAGSLGLGVWAMFSVSDPATLSMVAVLVLVLSLILGVMLVIPIGGADMPVVISLLNSYSGLAASATGFVLQNNVLIISGALVGASGLILTQIMCVAMNRTLANVLFGGFGMEADAGATSGAAAEYGVVRSFSAEEAALVLENAESVMFVPGYGLAVAQAQHAVRELANQMEKRGTKVAYAIHPVAGRMPGHMNVLLAEADVPYEQLLEMDNANPEFRNTDVAIIVGANDVVNPAAEKAPGSPIYGMPVLEVWNAATVIMIKRSLSPGFAGIKNELFEYENTMMLFEDAKKAVQGIVTEMKEL
ncbi:MAG: NAD(P)(+) transhydrogenase (Re/Si-specific) subunit beta [Thermoanaerobaculia bacterium]|nr:NAD(P)(+) transhydrogenase (Re/Si-specific) subunit beta [Thermoanaerobaculia bacterium]